uniref:Uncharacterized protein n=1 Tax=Spongospora subterranea TaxID=70186 RepID=A0A0H5RHW8_9EUKA|eukprot:CRZ08274.1 hypothetical protein [Spongospora subterranea]
MAFYLLQRFDEANLLADSTPSNVCSVLQMSLDQITAGDYAKARWLWCTKVLKIPNDGTLHDLMQDVDSAYLDHLPELVTFEATVSSACQSPLCPRPQYTKSKRYRHIVARNPRQFTQADFDASLVPIPEDCDQIINSAALTEFGECMFQLKSNLFIDTEETLEMDNVYVCGRIRHSQKLDAKSHPKLLILNCLEHWERDTDAKYHLPARVLSFGTMEYALGAIIYGNGAHFCCHVFVKGGVLFYDGLAKRKLRWHLAYEVTLPDGYLVNQL